MSCKTIVHSLFGKKYLIICLKYYSIHYSREHEKQYTYCLVRITNEVKFF